MQSTLLPVILLLLSCNFAVGQSSIKPPKEKIKIILLGTYHFANPGLDKFNMTADNHLSSKRQIEIAQVNASLSRFTPDKIFIEIDSKWQNGVDSAFREFKANRYSLIEKKMVNEAFQIGFQLAKQLQHAHIYCADAPGDWFEDRVKHYADSAGLDFYKELEAKGKSYTEKLNTYMSTHSVKETLFLLNDPKDQLQNNHYFYNYIFPRVGAGDNYIGADLVGEWYKRNIRIYSNILASTTAEDKRILVVIGAGHIHILRHLFKDNPDFEVIEANMYLAGK